MPASKLSVKQGEGNNNMKRISISGFGHKLKDNKHRVIAAGRMRVSPKAAQMHV